MNHDEAKHAMASERYLLDELAPADREQFEEHMFSCQECALDVRAGKAFIDQSRVVLSAPEISAAEVSYAATKVVPSRVSWWAAWLRPVIAVPVLAVLLSAVVYQSVYEVPDLRSEAAARRAPAILASASLMNVNTRGGEVPAVKAPRGKPFLLFVDVPENNQYSSFVAEFYGPSQDLLWSLPISADSAKNTLSLRVPPVQDGSGSYTLEVHGVNKNGQAGPEIARYPFELEFQSR